MSEAFFCPIPWHSIAVRTNGDYRVCCHTNVIEGGGLLTEQNLPVSMGTKPADQMRNHELLNSIRKSFLKGEWNPACTKCKVGEEHGQRTGRIHALTRLNEQGLEKKFHQSILQKTREDGSIEPSDFPIQEMDLRFGNFCNLSCRTCGPADSTGWYSDWLKLGNEGYQDNEKFFPLVRNTEGKIVSLNQPKVWSEGIEFSKILPPNLNEMRHIYFAGGEPLISKDHDRLLEFLIAEGVSKNIYLEYNTNLSVLSEKTIKLWKEFKMTGVGISMDGFGRYHDYIRHPLKFDRIEKNILALDSADAPLRGWIACTVSWMNLAHLPDFIFWKHAKHYERINNERSRPPISFHLLHEPMELNLKSIPLQAKKYIESRVRAGVAEMRKQEIYPVKKLDSTELVLNGMISFMNSEDLSAKWSGLWKMFLKTDEIRGQDYSSVDPELFSLLNS